MRIDFKQLIVPPGHQALVLMEKRRIRGIRDQPPIPVAEPQGTGTELLERHKREGRNKTLKAFRREVAEQIGGRGL